MATADIGHFSQTITIVSLIPVYEVDCPFVIFRPSLIKSYVWHYFTHIKRMGQSFDSLCCIYTFVESSCAGLVSYSTRRSWVGEGVGWSLHNFIFAMALSSFFYTLSLNVTFISFAYSFTHKQPLVLTIEYFSFNFPFFIVIFNFCYVLWQDT